LERKVDAVIPTPLPNVETRRKPSEQQLAHVLEITLRVDPEKNEPTLIFKSLECFNIYTFILTTIPKSTAVIVERINPNNASSGK
jgi:hypothetical protein